MYLYINIFITIFKYATLLAIIFWGAYAMFDLIIPKHYEMDWVPFSIFFSRMIVEALLVAIYVLCR